MKDITEQVAAFREAARHLWNTAFQPGVGWNDRGWDQRDRFSRICVELFDALVVEPAGIDDHHLPQFWEHHPDPFPSIFVTPPPDSDIPIMINRSDPAGAYWDDPVSRVAADVQLQFVTFFDFGELERRDFRYLEVRIAECARHPHLVARRALVEFEHIRVVVA